MSRRVFDLAEYDYHLPPHLIAQVPVGRRDASRLLYLDRAGEAWFHHRFHDLPGLLRPGDLVVVNNTRVIPAKLYGRKESGGRIEALVLPPADDTGAGSNVRSCLLKASKRCAEGTRLFFEGGLEGTVQGSRQDGLVQVAFHLQGCLEDFLVEKGHMPLPPYIKRDRDDPREALDRERYQTIFSSSDGAVAAPTAGLHFTAEMVERLKERGVGLCAVTLHVGYGTFSPVRSRDIRRHRLAEEEYHIAPEAAEAIRNAGKGHGRVIAVGTTVVRTLESATGTGDSIQPGRGRTDLLITPGYRFKVVDGMVTNFHLPRSSLLFLVSAFAGLELVKKAYEAAVSAGYRFYSYGDAMLIL